MVVTVTCRWKRCNGIDLERLIYLRLNSNLRNLIKKIIFQHGARRADDVKRKLKRIMTHKKEFGFGIMIWNNVWDDFEIVK